MANSRQERALGRSKTRAYKCQVCNHSFSRSDSLKRHVQLHKPSQPPKKSRKKSCAQCSKSKIRCSGDRPMCANCLKRGHECVFSALEPTETGLFDGINLLPDAMWELDMMPLTDFLDFSAPVDFSALQSFETENNDVDSPCFAALGILERSPWHTMSATNFPSKEKVDLCIELYFTYFHSCYPFIHRPTFQPANQPLFLTLAMATIGASLGGRYDCAPFADALSELTRRLLLFSSEDDPNLKKTVPYLTAQLLQGYHAQWSGNLKLLQFSELTRSSLITNAGSMGLFQMEYNKELQWLSWVEQEKACRLAWGIYEYDASVSFLYNIRPFMSIARMRTYLASTEALWNAETADDWIALLSSSRHFFPEIIDGITTNKENIEGISELMHQRVIITSLSRMQWTLREIKSTTPRYFAKARESFIYEGYADLQLMLSSFEKGILLSLEKGLSPEDTSQAVRNLHIIAISYLNTTGDLVDWVLPLLREETPEVGRPESRISQWAAQNLSAVRQAAYHCAQILGMARRFPHCFPSQSFFIFYAGVILWYIAPSLRQSDSKSIALDDFPKVNKKELKIWLRGNSQITAGIEHVPDISSSLGRFKVLEMALEMLSDPFAPGIAQRFRVVIEQLLNRASS